MPEGHTIHRHARLQGRVLGGKPLRSLSPQGRFDDGAAIIDRQTLRRVEPLSKHLLYHFTRDVVHVHLGMHGRFRGLYRGDDGGHPLGLGEDGWPAPTGAVRWRFVSPKAGRGYDLSGPTSCKVVDGGFVTELRERIGPDLLAPDAMQRLPEVWDNLRTRRVGLGVALMDQSLISGIGNAYRAELLYRARIHPDTPCRDVDADAFARLYADSVYLLNIGVRHRHILCVEPEAVGKRGWRDLADDERFWVYRRERCRGCGAEVEEAQRAGRAVFWCPREQAMP